jgi:hypothetical protein
MYEKYKINKESGSCDQTFKNKIKKTSRNYKKRKSCIFWVNTWVFFSLPSFLLSRETSDAIPFEIAWRLRNEMDRVQKKYGCIYSVY